MISKDLEELHAMAEKIGLRREWFQGRARHPHYDLMAFTRALAVQHGATPGRPPGTGAGFETG